MNSPKALKSIVILGGGTAGWMTALSLVHSLGPSGIKISLVESSNIGTIGVGEATIPTIRRFYQSLGISDIEMIEATKATCKLGIQFEGWGAKNENFIHPFGGFGHDFQGIGFHHFIQAFAPELMTSGLDDWALGSALGKARKMALPQAITGPEAMRVYAQYDWALHLDAGLLAQFFKSRAVALGVEAIDATLEAVELHPETGFITGLKLETKRLVEGDFFVDCSGFSALLIEGALGVGYEPYDQWLLTDRALFVPSEPEADPLSLTRVTAREAGWQWHIPLQHRIGNGHVYASGFMSQEKATQALLAHLTTKPLAEPKAISFKPGRRRSAWVKNCVAIGLSSGFLEPLESTSIALIQTGIERLKSHLPIGGFDERLIKDHNEISQSEFERTRDFIILHYKLNQRRDTPFWQAVAEMSVPESLTHKIELYRTRGHFVRYAWEMFHPASWLAIYAGLGQWPEVIDPSVHHFGREAFLNALGQMRQSLDQIVEKAPQHKVFVDHCLGLAQQARSPFVSPKVSHA